MDVFGMGNGAEGLPEVVEVASGSVVVVVVGCVVEGVLGSVVDGATVDVVELLVLVVDGIVDVVVVVDEVVLLVVVDGGLVVVVVGAGGSVVVVGRIVELVVDADGAVVVVGGGGNTVLLVVGRSVVEVDAVVDVVTRSVVLVVVVGGSVVVGCGNCCNASWNFASSSRARWTLSCSVLPICSSSWARRRVSAAFSSNRSRSEGMLFMLSEAVTAEVNDKTKSCHCRFASFNVLRRSSTAPCQG